MGKKRGLSRVKVIHRKSCPPQKKGGRYKIRALIAILNRHFPAMFVGTKTPRPGSTRMNLRVAENLFSTAWANLDV
jgi:hypothetical protein